MPNRAYMDVFTACFKLNTIPHLPRSAFRKLQPATMLAAGRYLLITFREWIRLDQVFGFENHIILAVKTCFTDTGF